MCDYECNKECKIEEYLDKRISSWERRLFGNLVIACEGEKLNTSEIFENYCYLYNY